MGLTLGKAPEAQWIDLGEGAQLLMAPITVLSVAQADQAMRQTIKRIGVSFEELAEGESEAVTEVGVSNSLALIRAGVRDWRGVNDEAGQAIPFSLDHFDALMLQYPDLYQTIEQAYIWPYHQRLAEKNASSPSPGGILPATATAPSAGATIAPPATETVPNVPASFTDPKARAAS